MATRRNAKQSEVESTEKLAENGKVSPPKRTKLLKPIVAKKDSKSTKSNKTTSVENNDNIIKNELETVKKSNTRNKVVSTTAKSTAKVTSNPEQTTKLKRIAKKSKPLIDDNSSNDPNGLNNEVDNEISEKVAVKKTRARKVTEKAGTTADPNNVGDVKVKPNTRAKKVETLKDPDLIPADAKGKKKEKVSNEPKTKAKPLKKNVEKNDAIVEEKKKAINTRAKTTENNKPLKSTSNDEKKSKMPTRKMMRGQTDNVSDETESNVEEIKDSKLVKGKPKKSNKVNATIATNNSKKGRGKKMLYVSVNEKEKELEAVELLLEKEEKEEREEEEEEEEKGKEEEKHEKQEQEEEEEEEEEDKDKEDKKMESKEISKNNLQKVASNVNNGSPNSESQ